MAESAGAGETFGALVRRYRLAAALSQEGLAERAGLSVDAVSVIERGRRGAPRPDTVMLLARALGLEGEARSAFVAAAHATAAAPAAVPGGAVPSTPPPWLLDLAPLPVALTGFVGREREVAAVRARLLEPSTRLLTLTGPGGTGKTRLAVEVARAVTGAFADGVAFVVLATLTDPDFVPPTIVRALGLREQPGQSPLDLLRAVLRDKRLLLVLDNCEQVAVAASQFADLLMAAPGVRILATSRARLAIAGERLYPVPPLGLPTPEQARDPAALGTAEAVRLFVERAQDALPDFALDVANAVAVGAICARLDGLPLAIELAAARIRHLPPPALLKRLEGSLALLTGGPRDVPERQRTLREAINWSYALLDGEGKALFRRVSVFVGGWTLAAAEAVCASAEGLPALTGDVLLGLAMLADQSLVVVESDPQGEPRYRLLETVRVFGRAQLSEAGEMEVLASAHAAWCVAVTEEAEPALAGVQQATWLARLEQEHDNLRAALSWATERRAEEVGLRLAGAVWRYWDIRGHVSEGRTWLEIVLSNSGRAAPVARARALTGAGNLAYSQGDYTRAVALHEESLALRRELGDEWGIAASLNNLAIVACEQGDYTRGTALNQEALAMRRELGDMRGIAISLNNLGLVASDQGDYTRAIALHEESLALTREMGNKVSIATSLNNLGLVAFHQGDYARAAALHQEALALKRELGNKGGIAVLLNNLGLVTFHQGDYTRVVALLHEALLLSRDVGARILMAEALEPLAWSVAVQGRPERAAQLVGSAAALRETLGVPLAPEYRLGHDQAVKAMRTALGEEVFAATLAAGRALPLDEAVTMALAVDLAQAE
jgi:predicted ATPase/transcriptional regulator with XRE-family HTH domain/Tfp pilus assembly protein PilF